MFKKIDVTRNMFDLFYGDGWNTCARIRKNKDNTYTILKSWGDKTIRFWLTSLDNSHKMGETK